jgi:hypothetical protein
LHIRDRRGGSAGLRAVLFLSATDPSVTNL